MTVIIDKSSENIISTDDSLAIINQEDVTIVSDQSSNNTIRVESDTPYIVVALEQGPQGIPGPVGDEELKYDLILEEINAEGDLYVGEAMPGSSTSSAVWRIYFYDEKNSGGTRRYADGTADFSKVWDDRASYTY